MERAVADTTPVPAPPYLNRELSLLAFQRRVLEEAEDETTPLLERLKFLAILGSNLTEFFMVRVAALKEQVAAGVTELSPDGLTATQQLAAIRPIVLELMQAARACFRTLRGALEEEGIVLCEFHDLAPSQRDALADYFEDRIFPVLTPLAFDPGRPFPHISNLSLNLAVLIKDEVGAEHFARVKVPDSLPRLVRVPEQTEGAGIGGGPGASTYVWLDQVIAANVERLFPGMTVLETHLFRLVRDAEMHIQELEAEDLLETIEQGVRRRRFGSVVRLTVTRDMPDEVRSMLVRNLELEPEDVYDVDPPLGTSYLDLLGLERPDLRDPAFRPGLPAPLHDKPEQDIFAAIRQQDILLHHPFDSFAPVVDFLRSAARDRDVLAIKQTLYRVGRDSPVVAALLEAAGNGKQVAVLVELKARFDEENNIEWARALEAEGVHVVYGLLGLKTHSKIALVVRREGEGLRRYVHLGTGNYNAVTAQLYTDIGLLTCDPILGADASDFFNLLTGYSIKDDYRRFLVAPLGMRACLEQLIRREIEWAGRGEPARLIFKVNALVDKRMIPLLYEASQAGVHVDLLVRGICCLLPGLPGVSENIRVTSIVGRFLEHSRVYYFRNGGAEEVYLGSADLMPRNLNRRVELLFPVLDERLREHLRDEVLAVYLADNVKARIMQPDGTYVRRHRPPGVEGINAQEWLIASRAVGAR